MSKLYNELAVWWPLLSPVAEYAEEAAFFAQVLIQAGLPPAPSLLELGSGGGNNAHHMQHHFAQVTLTDLSPAMLALSRTLNPGCEHQQGDMRTLRLGRTFDAVFVHDAIEYMTTADDLRAALVTAAVHCKPGGWALFVPDFVQETFEPETEHGGADGEGRSLRYLEWAHAPAQEATQYSTDYVYVMHEGNGAVRFEHEEHICGLFPRETWLQLLRDAGFAPEIVHDAYARELFLARRIAA
jgi:SAM-dependent methyltransferase